MTQALAPGLLKAKVTVENSGKQAAKFLEWGHLTNCIACV